MAKTFTSLCLTWNVQITVKHFVILCPNFTEARNEFHMPENLYEIIRPFSGVNELISYLKNNLNVKLI